MQITAEPLTIITKRSILDAAAVLDPPMKLVSNCIFNCSPKFFSVWMVWFNLKRLVLSWWILFKVDYFFLQMFDLSLESFLLGLVRGWIRSWKRFSLVVFNVVWLLFYVGLLLIFLFCLTINVYSINWPSFIVWLPLLVRYWAICVL